jgi:hypothetical protein
MIKIMKRVTAGFLISISVAATLVAVVWFFLEVNIFQKDILERSWSNNISLQSASELVIVKVANSETFESQEFKKILGLFVGDTKVSITVPAVYNYYVKPDEIKIILDNKSLFVKARGLYLQKPVGFDSAQELNISKETGLGRDSASVKDDLRRSLTEKLASKGMMQIGFARQRAYESLAKSVHDTLKNLGLSDSYEDIVVIFQDDRKNISQKFSFDNGACNTLACRYGVDFDNTIIGFESF